MAPVLSKDPADIEVLTARPVARAGRGPSWRVSGRPPAPRRAEKEWESRETLLRRDVGGGGGAAEEREWEPRGGQAGREVQESREWKGTLWVGTWLLTSERGQRSLSCSAPNGRD